MNASFNPTPSFNNIGCSCFYASPTALPAPTVFPSAPVFSFNNPVAGPAPAPAFVDLFPALNAFTPMPIPLASAPPAPTPVPGPAGASPAPIPNATPNDLPTQPAGGSRRPWESGGGGGGMNSGGESFGLRDFGNVLRNMMRGARGVDGLPEGARPPSLTPQGAGRQGALNEAKRQNGIPTSQQPIETRPNVDKRGNPQPGLIYEYEVPAPGGGTKRIQREMIRGGHLPRRSHTKQRPAL